MPTRAVATAAPHRSPWRVFGLVCAALLALGLVAAAVLLALAWHPSIAPLNASEQRAAFAPALVQRGQQLAAVGNCAGCHTAPGGVPYAGGLALATPFGTVHGTNLTPDAATGIGAWSQAAFDRAMRAGVARDGSLLYPAFPYDHFTGTSDADLQALYAFLMTRDAVQNSAPANDLVFPLGWRPLLAGWNLLFLHRGASQPDAPQTTQTVQTKQTAPSTQTAQSAQSAQTAQTAQTTQAAQVDRGAYLAQTLGHCGGCHTPRNALGAERRERALDGGDAEGWYAPPLNARSPSPLPWDVPRLTAYLRTGIAAEHAIAGGPMQGVVATLAQADPADVEALAAYIVQAMGAPSAQRLARAAASRQRAAQAPAGLPTVADDKPGSDAALGARVYATACVNCHASGRQMTSNSALQLPLAVALYDESPRSFLRIVRDGIAPLDGQPGRWMPAFGNALSDEQLTALADYLRRSAADAPPWPNIARAVADSRSAQR